MTKTFTFAILHFTVAFGVAYLLTGSIAISSTVALVEPIVNTLAFFFHEKAWQRFENKHAHKTNSAHTQWKLIPATAAVSSCCVHHKLFVSAHEVKTAAQSNEPNRLQT